MSVDPITILPSQNFLKPTTLTFILECFKNGELQKLPPDPIVRHNRNGNLVAIDGHNLIAVKLFRNEAIDVHIARTADDGLPETSAANIQRNQDLHDKFESVLAERANTENEGIMTFQNLIKKYPEIL